MHLHWGRCSFIFPKRSDFSFEMAVCHLAWIRISEMIRYSCGILAWESLGSGRFPYSLLKCQGTYNLPCGCFTVGLLSPLSLEKKSWVCPSVFLFLCFLVTWCVVWSWQDTAGVFPAFHVVPWIATRYLGELHNLAKPLKFHHSFPQTSR